MSFNSLLTLGEHFRGPYRDAHIKGAYISAFPGTAHKKGDCVRASLCKSTYHTMEISKDSQFLEVCKKPILTDLPVLIKT